MKTKLYDYQKDGVAQIESFDGHALLADEMGLGKTIQSLWYFRKHHKECTPAVVICPASLKYNWAREAMQHIRCRADVLEGSTPPKIGWRHGKHRLLIINYDILDGWLEWLFDVDPKLIIVDECHLIKNPNSKRSIAVKELCQGRDHIIGISGTPLISRPAELFPMLQILDPEEFSSFLSFAFDYCKPRLAPWGWEYKGATNIQQLNTILKLCCMIRRRKSDVLKQLPDKTRTVVPIKLDAKDYKEYADAENDFIKWLSKSKGKAKAAKAKKAKRLMRVGYLKRLAAQLKLKHVLNWIDNFLETTDEKLVVFGVHQDVLLPIYEKYKKKAVLVDGSVTGKLRQFAVDKFQKDKRIRLFVGNIKAAGVGLTLTAASNIVFAELGWTPGDHTQAEDRIHRIGQENAAVCHYLVSLNTMEEELCQLLQKKQAILEATLDGEDNGDDLDIFDKLITKIEKRKFK